MSKLQELIQRLCPDGVKYKKLGEICIFKRGDVLSSKDAVEGDVPVMAGGQKPSCYHNVPNRKGETIVVAGSGAYAGFVTYWNIPVFVSDAFSVHPIDGLLPKYVFHYLKNNQAKIYATKKGAGVPHVHGKDIAKFLIPVPPFEVQEEIVRILDRFSDYAAELQAELQARKEQYEYYRNLLLTFNPAGCAGEANDEQEGCVTTRGGHSYPIQWKTMGEVFEMSAGKAIPADRIKNQMSEESPIKCYGANGLRGYVNLSSHIGPNVIIGRQGALCGNITYATGKFYATDHAVVVCASEIFHPRFIFHMLTHANLNQYKTAGAQPGLSVSRLQSVSIPVPPLELQEKIVAVLDRFETLVNDLSEGLPAEIAAVKEQYEYYRNRLLTFKEKTA